MLQLTTIAPVLVFGARLAPDVDSGALTQAAWAAYDAAPRRAPAFGSNSETSFRDMRTLGSLDLDEVSGYFGKAYERVRIALGERISAPVFAVPDRNERYVVNVLDRPADEQGWHHDVYAYAVNFMVEAPVIGGALEIDLGDDVVSLEIPGETWYALRTDTVRHRVAPLGAGRRVVVNFAYHSSDAGPATSYSSDRLYARQAANT